MAFFDALRRGWRTQGTPPPAADERIRLAEAWGVSDTSHPEFPGGKAPAADPAAMAAPPEASAYDRDQWVRKLKRILEQTRPGILALWGNDGRVSQEDSLTCIRLMGQEVFPAIREIAKSLDLKSPFEADAPVHLKYSKDLKPAKAAAAAE